MTIATSRRLPHRVEFGGPEDGPRVVLVHGLGGSHANWAALGPLLAATTRPVAVDLAGFGYTPGARKTAHVAANARPLARFLRGDRGARRPGRQLDGRHDLDHHGGGPPRPGQRSRPPRPGPALGTGRTFRPAAIAGIATALMPIVGPRLLTRRRSVADARQRALSALSICYSDISRLADVQLDVEVELTETAEAEGLTPVAAYVGAARSLVLHGARRRHRREMAATTAPVLLLHGTHDRLVSVTAADAAARGNPSRRYQRQDGGHVPHMEIPAETAHTITAWLEGKDT
jgi:pimeloyl-ACP methyl ester carboxylesterase